ncbi:MAG: type II toxin-antitoxin system HicA family toxin [Clostridiales bacterium]|jgi:predicted RNA binding protein YcfA (HicA-like mRNA interferase family)|nr:type II toxin-antitoxin system HicA family toxin [Clostridiales bacterium]
MKYSELKKILRSAGCYKESEGTSHERWYSPITGKRFPVGRHDAEDVHSGTFHSIQKAAGIK